MDDQFDVCTITANEVGPSDMEASLISKIQRPVYLEVNLDRITKNVNILRKTCQSNTAIIGVVKSGAYGHGSIQVSHHLKNIGVERLAVSTLDEAIHLREHRVKGPIHVFGSTASWQMASCLDYNLIPTVSDEKAILGMADALKYKMTNNRETNGLPVNDDNIHQCEVPEGSVNIKVDTGLYRNGCHLDDLPKLVQLCDDLAVHVDAVYTHFIDSWSDRESTEKQLDTFLQGTDHLRSLGIKRHVANSGAILRGYGTDLDFVRPGSFIFGLPPDTSEDYMTFGLEPVARIVSYPTLLRTVPRGCKVGYCSTYTTKQEERMAILPVGYADGYYRDLTNKGFVIRDKTGERCPVVGRVAMDAINVRVPGDTTQEESFTVVSPDYDPCTSATGIANIVGGSVFEFAVRLSYRIPRVYTSGTRTPTVVRGLSPQAY